MDDTIQPLPKEPTPSLGYKVRGLYQDAATKAAREEEVIAKVVARLPRRRRRAYFAELRRKGATPQSALREIAGRG